MSARAGLVACALLCGCAGPSSEPVTVSDGRYAMGTVLEVTLHGRDEATLRQTLNEIFALAAELDALFSRYDPESELSRLNRSAGSEAVPVDPRVADILRDSREWALVSRGTFDVTVGPLVELWTQAAQRDAAPTADELERARARVGAERIRVDDADRVTLPAGTVLDLGGVAKGWALDRMLPLLRAHGLEGALLNFGQSSTWAFGGPPDGPMWRLLARAPEGGFVGVVALRDQALSVSGSLGQWSEIGGRRYGHVLDPRSGQPLLARRQALVVAPSAGLAEALSKALLVLGEDAGIALVETLEGCEALLLDADGGHWRTSGWAVATRFEPLPGP